MKLNPLAGGTTIIENDDLMFRLSGSIRYSLLDYGEATMPYPDIGTSAGRDHSLNITATIGSTYLNNIHWGFGISLKPIFLRRALWAAIEGGESGNANDLAFDAGMLLKADFFMERGFLVSPSLGISYLNLGNGVDFINADQLLRFPENIRYGFGLRLQSPNLESIDEILGRKTPILTFISNYDVIKDQVNENRPDVWGVGTEIGLFQSLFLRYGHINDKGRNIIDYCVGVGIGFTVRKIQGRFDYAHVPQVREMVRVNKYGLTLGYLF